MSPESGRETNSGTLYKKDSLSHSAESGAATEFGSPAELRAASEFGSPAEFVETNLEKRTGENPSPTGSERSEKLSSEKQEWPDTKELAAQEGSRL